MKAAIVIPPKEFKDESLSRIMLMLGKWNLETALTSYTKTECVGSHGAVYRPDINTARVDPSDYDAIILLDGNGVDSYRLFEFRPLLDLVSRFSKSGKVVFGIGNAVKIMACAGVIDERKVAAIEDEDTRKMIRVNRGTISNKSVEADQNIITGKETADIPSAADLMLVRLGLK